MTKQLRAAKGSVYLPLVIALATTLVSGAVFGTVTQRWGMSDGTDLAAERLGEVPEKIGDWRMVSSDPASERVTDMLRLAGHFNRTYQHRRTGETVEVHCVLGPAGPISVHQPEICFRNNAYSERGERQTVNVGGDSNSFWSLTFDPSESNLDGGIVCVYYAWSSGDAWTAPSDARFHFAGNSHLYKLQVTTCLPATADLDRGDPCRAFLADFVPVVNDYVEPARSLSVWN